MTICLFCGNTKKGIDEKGVYHLINNNKNNSPIRKLSKQGVSARFNEPERLSEDEKRNLQVKDGQHNHHVDERGGAK